ncbi:unnamed protein product [Macrosiphum euphorbiae]|uniref:Uncharacterized protein n=1 Tax=Macrosiphum euphorbiae TaxID=13131 RepID=A0AAV0XF07_9HEMI|nr:unnamed protein product [Macrosiphum euphorbiae]
MESCFRSYDPFDSFNRHLLTRTTVLNQDVCSNIHVEPLIIDTSHDTCNEALMLVNNKIPRREISIESFKRLVTSDAIILISKWYNEAVVPKNQLQLLLGNRNKNITKDYNIVIQSVNVNICFIPLRCVFKMFFEQPFVLKTVLENFLLFFSLIVRSLEIHISLKNQLINEVNYLQNNDITVNVDNESSYI